MNDYKLQELASYLHFKFCHEPNCPWLHTDKNAKVRRQWTNNAIDLLAFMKQMKERIDHRSKYEKS